MESSTETLDAFPGEVMEISMGDYFVVALTRENPLAEDNRLHSEGVRLLKDSLTRIRLGQTREGLQEFEEAIVYTLLILPPNLRQQFQTANITAGHTDLPQAILESLLNPPAEYAQYDRVHFLNDVALRMYQEGGVDLQVLKSISEEDLPEGCSRSLRGPYVPH